MFFLSAFLSALTHFTSLQTSVILFFLKIFLVARWTKQWAEKKREEEWWQTPQHSVRSSMSGLSPSCLSDNVSQQQFTMQMHLTKLLLEPQTNHLVLWFWSDAFDTQTWRTGVAHSLAAGGALTWERKFVLMPSPSSTKTSLDCFSLFSCQWLHTYRAKY